MNKEVKVFEIRDRATFVPVMAIQVSNQDGYLVRRAGFGATPCVYLLALTSEKARYDPYNWDNRTFGVAHQHIAKHWDELKDDEVIDVEYILGETSFKKVSERVQA